MKQFLIVLDLDDTLLKSDKTISNKTVKYIKKLEKLNHLVVLASGRPFRGMEEYYNLLDLKTPCISDNGALLTFPGNNDFKVIKTYIKNQYFIKSFNENKNIIREAFFSIDNDLYIYNKSGRLDFLYKTNSNSIVHEIDYSTLKKNIHPYGVIYVINSEYKVQFENYFKENFDNTIKTRSWGYDTKNAIYEVYNANSDKSHMVNILLEHYSLTSDNLVLFGDGTNDILMFELGHAVAMKNALDEVKIHAKDITKYDNNHDGVRRHLKNFLKKNK